MVLRIILLVLGLLGVGLYVGVRYLYHYAFVPGKKAFLTEKEMAVIEHPYADWEFLERQPRSLSLRSRDGLLLKGVLHQHQTETPQLAMLAHGYGNKAANMKKYTRLFYELGYDVFLADARGHGESQGEYIGFGWHERLDYLDWLAKLKTMYPEDVTIVLFGVSMGAATILNTAGEELPKQVKALIADCGFASLEEELSYQLKSMYRLPAFPLIPLASAYTKKRIGFSFSEDNPVKQISKNKLPLLLIHGEQDSFIPVTNVDALYQATQGKKEKWLVPGAEHAKSLKQAPEEYQQKVATFLQSV